MGRARRGTGACLLACHVLGCADVFDLESIDPIHAPTCSELTAHDEDADLVADGCDNCIGMANPTQEDMDEDGIGDVCDPQPGSIDSVLASFTFDDPTQESLWLPGSGFWVIEDDAYVQKQVLPSGSQQYNLYAYAAWGAPLAVEALVTIDALGSSYRSMGGVVALVPPGMSSGNECNVSRRSAASEDEVFAYDSFKASLTSPLLNSQLGPGARYLIRMSVVGRAFRCRVDGLAGDGGAIFHTMDDELVEPAHAGFLVENASVRYHYLVVYQLGT